MVRLEQNRDGITIIKVRLKGPRLLPHGGGDVPYYALGRAFPGGSDGKESACNAGDLCLIPGLERSPERGHGNLLQYSCLENPHGQRSLADYSP